MGEILSVIPERFYFHGNEVDNFIYIQIPKPLIKDPVFSTLTDSAKILYALLLNRTGKSRKNGWVDERGKVYINYSVNSIVEEFGVCQAKAKALFAELVNVNRTGIGLIKKVRVAGSPSRIYVMNFKKVMNRLTELAIEKTFKGNISQSDNTEDKGCEMDMDPQEPYYFRGDEIDDFIYLKLPISLVNKKVFSDISSSAKILYAILLDLSGKSMRNGWLDDDGRVYVKYTIEELVKEFGVKKRKAIMLFKELTDINGRGIGLIKKKHMANRPSRIYVMNFTEVYDYLIGIDENAGRSGKLSISRGVTRDSMEVHENSPRRCTKTAQGSARRQPMEVHENSPRRCTEIAQESALRQLMEVHENSPRKCTQTAEGSVYLQPMEVHEGSPRKCIVTAENNKDFSKTDRSNNHLISSYPDNVAYADEPVTKMDKMIYARDIIKENIEYDELVFRHEDDASYKGRLDELLEIMVEVCASDKEYYSIGDDKVPKGFVESAMFHFDYGMMEYVMDSLERCTKKVKNPKAYLIATLYNATKTYRNHEKIMVNHTMYGA